MERLIKSSVFSIGNVLSRLCLFLLSYQLNTTSANVVVNPTHMVVCSSSGVLDMQWRISYFNNVLVVNRSEIEQLVEYDLTVAEGITISTSSANPDSLHSIMSILSGRGERVQITVICSGRARVNGFDVTFRNKTSFLVALLNPLANELQDLTSSDFIPSNGISTTSIAPAPTASIMDLPAATTDKATPTPSNLPGDGDIETVDLGLDLTMVLIIVSGTLVGVACFTAILLATCLVIVFRSRSIKKKAKKCDEKDDIVYDYAYAPRTGTVSSSSSGDVEAMTINDSYRLPTEAHIVPRTGTGLSRSSRDIDDSVAMTINVSYSSII